MKPVSDAKRNTSNAARKAISSALTEFKILRLRGKMGGEDYHPEFDCDLTDLHSDIERVTNILKELKGMFPTYDDR